MFPPSIVDVYRNGVKSTECGVARRAANAKVTIINCHSGWGKKRVAKEDGVVTCRRYKHAGRECSVTENYFLVVNYT
jgi:hypothetical protein